VFVITSYFVEKHTIFTFSLILYM